MLRIPLDRLPANPEARRAALRDYFCDKDAEAVESANGWELTLAWPDGLERHVDPLLDIGLAWWGEGVSRTMMGLAYRREGRRLTALFDSWTLFSWSEWLQRSGGAGDLVILHVDDHMDLAPPRLFIERDTLTDAITGAVVRINEPPSVRAAILSGAIGIGSYFAPFLHHMPHAEVRHLRQAPKTLGTTRFRICPAVVADTLIAPHLRRPAIELKSDLTAIGPGTYTITPNLDEWLKGISPSATVLLHVDLDYFNNRYDGDSDWTERVTRLNPGECQVVERMHQLLEALAACGVLEKLHDCSIAYSPSFFPAELWQIAHERFSMHLPRR